MLAAGAVVVIVYPFLASTYLLQIGFQILLYVAIGEAWNLIAGYGGMVSLGSAAFIGTGAYTLAELTGHGFPLVAAVVAGGAIAAVFAAAISPAMFRLRGVYFSVATLALAEALLLLISTISTFGGTTGLLLRGAVPSYLGLYWWGLGCAALSTAIVVWLLRIACRSRCGPSATIRMWLRRWASTPSVRSSWRSCLPRSSWAPRARSSR